MAVSYGSGSVHFSGLGSETDWDTMITQLKQIESHQKNRFTLWQADWNKRIQAFQKLNTAMLSLNSTLNSMNTINKFLLKNGVSSKEDIMTAVASGTAQNGTNKVQVKELATNAAYTWEGSKFSSPQDKANPTNQTQQFVYTYKGKTVKVAIGANATMQQFINQINSDANNPGVRASLVKDGSEYVFQFQGQDTGASATLTIDPSSSQGLAIKPPTENPIPTKYSSPTAVVNSSGSNQNFVYKYNGFDFTVDVANGATLEDLRDAINNDTTNQGSNKRVTASVIDTGGGNYALKLTPENTNDKLSLSASSQIKTIFTTDGATSTGWDSMSRQTQRTSSDQRFDKVDRAVNTSGSALDFVWTDSKGQHTISVADQTSLKGLADQINSTANSSTRAEVCKDKNGYYLQLTELNPNVTSAPTIDATTDKQLAITGNNANEANWTTETDNYLYHSQGFAGADSVINTTSVAQDFKYTYDGKTYTVSVNPNETLKDLVAKINANTDTGGGTVAANTLVQARVASDGSGYHLYLAPVDSSSTKELDISSDSSSCLLVAPSRGAWSTSGNSSTYSQKFNAATDVINKSGAAQDFTFIDGSGTARTVSLAANATLQDLLNAVNAGTGTHNVTASTVTVNGKLQLQLTGSDGAPKLESSSSTMLEIKPNTGWSKNTSAKSIKIGTFADTTSKVNTSGSNQSFIFTYKNQSYKVDMPDGYTLEQLKDKINTDFGTLVTASIEGSAGNYQLQLKGSDSEPAVPGISEASSSMLGMGNNQSTSRVPAHQSSVMTFSGFKSDGTLGGDIINKGSAPLTFTYTANGITGSIDVPPGCTVDQFIAMINSNSKMPNVRAEAEYNSGTGEYTLRMFSTKNAKTPPVVSPASTKSDDFAVKPPKSTVTVDDEVPVSIFGTPLTGATVINPTSGKTEKFMVEYQGKNISINIEPGETVDDLINKINNTKGGQIKANLFTDTDGNQYLQLWGTDPADTRPPQVSTTSSSELFIKPPDISSGDWYIQLNSNAKIKLNDWPGGADEWIESETNAPTELIEGVTLTFKEVGTSQITVTTNDAGIKEQVVALVDALNSVRSLINELTKVNKDKNPEEIGEAASNFDAQYGSILTGNYGVQLLSSILKSNTASQAKGFQYQHTDAEGLLTGDLFTSLAHVGITTDAETNSPTFGLLKIDEAKLDACLKQDPESVANLFAADNKASTNSSDFSFANYISGTTQPGVYEFHYEIDSNDNILDPYVMYQGKKYKASYDSGMGQLTIMEGPGQGLSVTINNTAQGVYTGTVTLKMGKVGELAALTKEMNSENGIINTLTKNYQQISKNIQDKIDKEDERLIVWERTMRAKFARLEAVLAQYNALNTQLESTIKTLPSGKSS